MRRSLLIIMMLLVSFGCINEIDYKSPGLESLSQSQGADLDQDGLTDYTVYTFSPSKVDGGGMQVQRIVSVTTISNATYTAIDPALTDNDLYNAEASLASFSEERIQDYDDCAQDIGLADFACQDIATCSKLCSGASMRCRRIAADYDEALASAMLTFQQDNNEIKSLTADMKQVVRGLRQASKEEQDAYLADSRMIVAKIAEINSNPLYTHPDLQLCANSDYGITHLLDAAKEVGTYSTSDSAYHYTMMVMVEPTAQGGSAELGAEVGGIGITDTIPSGAVLDPDEIASMQGIAVKPASGGVAVEWESKRASEKGYILIYEFDSDQPPETVLQALAVPDVAVRTLDLSGLRPTNFLFLTLHGVLDDYYLALGMAVGLSVAGIILLYNIIVLLFTIIGEKTKGGTFTAAFRKTFGRTDVRWKSDIVVSLVLLAAGFGISTMLAQQPATLPNLMQTIDALLTDEMGIIATALSAVGALLLYLAIENFVKIMILEQAYGMVIKQEKDMFLARAAALKDGIKELQGMVEEYGKQDFDVSSEYDVLTTVKSVNVDELTKKMTPHTKSKVDELSGRVESAVSSLRERKKIADDNWESWKGIITKQLDEQGEVYVSALVTVPASLRAWSLSRYYKEVGPENLSLERDALKRRKVTSAMVVRDMLDHGLIKGVVVLKQEKIQVAEFADANATVMTALAIKLRSYVYSLAKNLGQPTPQTFASVGQDTVMLLLKNRTTESILFLPKERFKEAVELWKSKIKVIEGG